MSGSLKLVKLLDPLQIVNIPSGLVPRGAYNAGTDYAVGDSVDYNGSSYVMFNNAAAGVVPTNTTYWQVLANKGDTGAAGPTGATGPTGAAGSVGATGAGATGATGAASTVPGATGATGAAGATGSAGSAGSAGATGATGPTGSAGSNGAVGATGADGATGAAGSAGAQGATGATGAAGTNGSNGSNGAVGATGATGPTGNTGTTGATGAQGATGPGDFSSNTSTSVDSEIVLFSGTAGKTGKRATGTGITKITSGVLGTATAGTDYVSPTGTETLTNKRINPRIGTTASSGTPTIDVDSYDQYNITALAAAITSLSITGTPVDGQVLIVRIKDNGTTRNVIWDSTKFIASGVIPLLANTVVSKTHICGFIYDSVAARFVATATDVVGY